MKIAVFFVLMVGLDASALEVTSSQVQSRVFKIGTVTYTVKSLSGSSSSIASDATKTATLHCNDGGGLNSRTIEAHVEK